MYQYDIAVGKEGQEPTKAFCGRQSSKVACTTLSVVERETAKHPAEVSFALSAAPDCF